MNSTERIDKTMIAMAKVSLMITDIIADSDKCATPVEMSAILMCKASILQAAQHLSSTLNKEVKNDTNKSRS